VKLTSSNISIYLSENSESSLHLPASDFTEGEGRVQTNIGFKNVWNFRSFVG